MSNRDRGKVGQRTNARTQSFFRSFVRLLACSIKKGDCTNSSLSLFACSLDDLVRFVIIKANKNDSHSFVYICDMAMCCLVVTKICVLVNEKSVSFLPVHFCECDFVIS